MLTHLKQLFCDHIYKLEEKIFLERVQYKHKAVMVHKVGTHSELRFVEGDRYALVYKCVKCNHKKAEKFEEEYPSSELWEYRS